ncbi:MAG: hypothetical protein ACUVT7_07275 [Thermoplasmata archaeon]
MNRILSDAYSFGIQYMRTKVGAFFSFIFPLILILLFGAVFSGGGGEGSLSLFRTWTRGSSRKLCSMC